MCTARVYMYTYVHTYGYYYLATVHLDSESDLLPERFPLSDEVPVSDSGSERL